MLVKIFKIIGRIADIPFSKTVIDYLGLIAITAFFIHFLPYSVLSDRPASGGDTGSHFWPLVTLLKYGIPEWRLRVWNPGNLGGEPHLVHYFPFPYFVMSFFSIFVPPGMAFNFGTLLPMLILPITVYLAIKWMGYVFPCPILASASSLCFLYNESYSMWGGNTLSTLAGQFAHLYALCFLLLGVGSVCKEIREGIFPLWSVFFFSATVLSHAYVMLVLPIFSISVVLFYVESTWQSRLKTLLIVGFFSAILSLWFLVPMIANNRWTVPFFFTWLSSNIWSEIVPRIFYPILIILVLSLGFYVIRHFYAVIKGKGSVVEVSNHSRQSPSIPNICVFWGLPILWYIALYFIFPKIGLVDVRAVPQISLFVCILSGVILGNILALRKSLSEISSFLIIPAVIFWTNHYVVAFPQWLPWNYNGWERKEPYPHLVRLYNHIRAGFSDPRVVYEHNAINNNAGTERVFEMLPYFANRATLESVYLQATILAPAAFLIQSYISLTPSCPFLQFSCVSHNIRKAKDILSLLGVGEIILVTDEIKNEAKIADYLEKDGDYGMWSLFKLKEQPSLVGTFNQVPEISVGNSFLDRFYTWLKEYTPSSRFIVVNQDNISLYLSPSNLEFWIAPSTCKSSVIVEFNRLRLKTNCPGYAHYLKFAMNSSWKASTRDPLFLVSPGFIGIIPSKEEVTLEFGDNQLWKLTSIISIIGFLCFALLLLRFRIFQSN